MAQKTLLEQALTALQIDDIQKAGRILSDLALARLGGVVLALEMRCGYG